MMRILKFGIIGLLLTPITSILVYYILIIRLLIDDIHFEDKYRNEYYIPFTSHLFLYENLFNISYYIVKFGFVLFLILVLINKKEFLKYLYFYLIIVLICLLFLWLDPYFMNFFAWQLGNISEIHSENQRKS